MVPNTNEATSSISHLDSYCESVRHPGRFATSDHGNFIHQSIVFFPSLCCYYHLAYEANITSETSWSHICIIQSCGTGKLLKALVAHIEFMLVLLFNVLFFKWGSFFNVGVFFILVFFKNFLKV